jgi:hypothetical protein
MISVVCRHVVLNRDTDVLGGPAATFFGAQEALISKRNDLRENWPSGPVNLLIDKKRLEFIACHVSHSFHDVLRCHQAWERVGGATKMT